MFWNIKINYNGSYYLFHALAQTPSHTMCMETVYNWNYYNAYVLIYYVIIKLFQVINNKLILYAASRAEEDWENMLQMKETFIDISWNYFYFFPCSFI